MNTAQRRSLLEGRGAKPSPTVTKIIQERESSGPGWIGTAFLISLLSQHDLSASDRSWIQGQIAAVGKEEEESTSLLPALHPNVKFAFPSLAEPLQSGRQASIHVSAQDAAGKSVPVECRVPASGDKALGHADLVFTPAAPGVMVMTCTAGGHQEKRLLYVVASKGVQ